MIFSGNRVTVLINYFSVFLYFFSVFAYAGKEYYKAVDAGYFFDKIYWIETTDCVYYEKLHSGNQTGNQTRTAIRELEAFCHCDGCLDSKQNHYCDRVKIKWEQLDLNAINETDSGEENIDSSPFIHSNESDSVPDSTCCHNIIPEIFLKRDIPGKQTLSAVVKLLCNACTYLPNPVPCLTKQPPDHTPDKPIKVIKTAINKRLFETLNRQLPVYDDRALLNRSKRLCACYHCLDMLNCACCSYHRCCIHFLCAMGHVSYMAGSVSGVGSCVTNECCVVTCKQYYTELLNFRTIEVAVNVGFPQDNDTRNIADHVSNLLESINTATSKLFSTFSGLIDFDYPPKLHLTNKGRIVTILRLKVLNNRFDKSDLALRLSTHQNNLQELEQKGKQEALYIPLFSNENDQLVEIDILLKKPVVIDKQPGLSSLP